MGDPCSALRTIVVLWLKVDYLIATTAFFAYAIDKVVCAGNTAKAILARIDWIKTGARWWT